MPLELRLRDVKNAIRCHCRYMIPTALLADNKLHKKDEN